MRVLRALWPVIFLVPLSWWADRGCSLVGIDPLYHATVWVHARLGWFVALLALASAAVVATKIVVARLRFGRLQAVAKPPPERLRSALGSESLALGMSVPELLFLQLDAPIATTVFGRTMLLSRGFIAPLNDDDLRLVVRHELMHVRRRDATAGVLWHLVFAGLLIPGFEPLERRLHARRERRAHLTAAQGHEGPYVALVSRLARGADLCAQAGLGLEAAAQRPEDRWLVWAAPLVVLVLTVALPASHLAFEHDLPYLLSHHC